MLDGIPANVLGPADNLGRGDSMRFAELVSLMRSLDLGDPGFPRRPSRDSVRAVQSAVGAGLATEEFSLDCIELELDAALGARQRPGAPANIRPFHGIPDRGIFFRLFYWPPGKDAPPHEHTSWTVTGVFHRALTVTTYDWETAVKERRLQPKNVFQAERGRVGHIYEPCIHRPSNPTDRLAVSLHIFNSNDGPDLEARVGPIEGLATDMSPRRWPTAPAAFERAVATWRERLLLMLADVLSRFRSPRAADLLVRLTERGTPLVQLVVATILETIDAPRAGKLLEELGEEAGLLTLRAS
jgi:hypothetical protein